jgi:hypothetical protein
MAGVAAPLLGATQQAVMSQMQRYSQIEDKKLEQMNSRSLERERREDIERRNSSEGFEEVPDPVAPDESAPAVP